MEKELEKEIEKIKERNKRVEKDKAWETSIVRKIAIAILTYAVVVLYSYLISRVSKSLFNIFSTSNWFFTFNIIIKYDKKNMGKEVII